MTSNWTNATLRKQLGEHGFLEKKDSLRKVVPDTSSDGLTYITDWVRHDGVVLLVTSDNGPPHIEDLRGNVLDVTRIGFRNVNIRAPGEGIQAP